MKLLNPTVNIYGESFQIFPQQEYQKYLCNLFKCDVLSIALLRIENSTSFLPSVITPKSCQKHKFHSYSNTLADFNNVNKEFLSKNSSQKNTSQKILTKKISQKNFPNKFLPKNSFQKFLPKIPKKIPKILNKLPKKSIKFPYNFSKILKISISLHRT
jgi:hypothetical protein